jgi:ubiquitin-like-conjugating enzyme ATG10
VSLTSHQSLISTPQEEDAAPVALLTQGDHPVLGVPCWYLHPCETSNAVVDILKEKEDGQWEDGEQGWTRWLEAWFVVLSTAVDLR